MAGNFPTQVNGLTVDHTSIRFSMSGGFETTLYDIESIDYKDSLTPSEGYGTHPIVLPSGLGQYKADPVTLTIYKEAYDDLIRANPDGFGAIIRSMTLTYVSRNQNAATIVEFFGCRIMSAPVTSSAGQGPTKVQLTIYVRYYTQDGKCLAPMDNDQVVTTIQLIA